MNILISNDDGIEAEGINELAKALKNFGTIYISAPAEQMSGASHSISTGKWIDIERRPHPVAQMAIAVYGTPVDSVKLGMKYFKANGIEIDLVVSGINHGSNLGWDTIYSGTVGAAMEGALVGKRAVAVSQNSRYPKSFKYACELAAKVVSVMREDWEQANERWNGYVININVPERPYEEIKGVKVARLGERDYDEKFETGQETGYRYAGAPLVYDNDDLGIDVTAEREGYATITPLKPQFTAFSKMDEVSVFFKC